MSLRSMLRNRTTSNVIANAAVAVVNGFIGILTISYLARELGAAKYGVWVLVALAASYLVILDLGLIAATGRRMAAKYAVGDDVSADRIASTHVAACIGLAVAICLIAIGGAFVFDEAFAVPSGLYDEAFYGVILTGASVAIYFLFSVFTCQLWARERFDLIAAIDIPIQVAKMLAILVLIDRNSSLATLAAIMLPGHVVAGLAAMAACKALGANAKLRPSYVSLPELKETFRLGLRLFAHQFTRTISVLAGTTIAGNRLGADAVTSYSLARVLTTYASGFVDAVAQTAAARAVKLHSGGDADQQRQLFVLGGRFASGCAILFLGGFLVLGEPFIRLWQGGRHDEVFLLLAVLAAGETMAMSQSVTTTVLLGMNRQDALIRLSLIEIAVVAALGFTLAARFGVLGLCVGVAIASSLVRGVGQCAVGCAALDMRPLPYLVHALLPSLLPAAPALLTAAVLARVVGVDSWLAFFLIGAAYSCTYILFFYYFLMRKEPVLSV